MASDGELFYSGGTSLPWGCHLCNKRYKTEKEARKCYKSHYPWYLRWM